MKDGERKGQEEEGQAGTRESGRAGKLCQGYFLLGLRLSMHENTFN